MGLFQWAEKKVEKLNIWDIGILKVYVLLIGMVIGAYVANFVQMYVWYFIAVIVVLMIVLLRKFFSK